MFKSLTLGNWRQFQQVEIEFDTRLTVLTGANGAGKTTILHLLNRHWGWAIPYVSSPLLTRKNLRKYWAGFWKADQSELAGQPSEEQHEIGQIEYSDFKRARLSVPAKVDETFTVSIDPQPKIEGVYVPSHRPLYLPKTVDQIPTKVDARKQLFTVYLNEVRNRFNLNARVQSPGYMLKQSLISLATFGYGSQAVTPNLEARQTFEGFECILRDRPQLSYRIQGYRLGRIS